jgi:PEP-CTERM motif
MKIFWAGQTRNGSAYQLRGGRHLGLECVVAFSAVAFLTAAPASALQMVTLNFDSVSLADPSDEYVYSPAERAAIKDRLDMIFLSDPFGGPFGITFEVLDPLSPPIPFTTSFINFNNGFMGGAAEKLDFRNTDTDDDADVNALGLLKAFDGSAKAGGGTWTLPELTSSSAVVMATANLAAHEIGHAMGLRHHDSFGPIGTGIAVSGLSYEPAYLGPGATNAGFHVMGLASTVALNADNLLTPSWLSERSAMKLTYNVASASGAADPEVGVLHGSPATAQPVPFSPVTIANTQLEPPDPYFPDPLDLTPLTEFDGFTGGITGATLDVPFALDYYSFFAPAGMVVTIEAVSKVVADTDPTRIPDPVDMVIELIDSTLSPVPYPVASPFTVNDDQFESTDSILIDVFIPTAGIYYIDVRASGKPGADITGEYELYVMGFIPPPPPFLAGDLNEDGFVGIDDLNIVLANWNDTVTVGSLIDGDPNGDGFVGIADLNIVLGNWNAGTPPPGGAVPEPTTLALLGFGGVLVVSRRR